MGNNHQYDFLIAIVMIGKNKNSYLLHDILVIKQEIWYDFKSAERIRKNLLYNISRVEKGLFNLQKE